MSETLEVEFVQDSYPILAASSVAYDTTSGLRHLCPENHSRIRNVKYHSKPLTLKEKLDFFTAPPWPKVELSLLEIVIARPAWLEGTLVLLL
jgi:hypothetical protein